MEPDESRLARQSPAATDAQREHSIAADTTNIREAFADPESSINRKSQNGYSLLEERRYDLALRAFIRDGDSVGLVQLGDCLMETVGMEFLAEDAYVKAGRSDKLADIGDRYASEGLRDSAVRMYATARAWQKLAALQEQIEKEEG